MGQITFDDEPLLHPDEWDDLDEIMNPGGKGKVTDSPLEHDEMCLNCESLASENDNLKSFMEKQRELVARLRTELQAAHNRIYALSRKQWEICPECDTNLYDSSQYESCKSCNDELNQDKEEYRKLNRDERRQRNFERLKAQGELSRKERSERNKAEWAGMRERQAALRE